MMNGLHPYRERLPREIKTEIAKTKIVFISKNARNLSGVLGVGLAQFIIAPAYYFTNENSLSSYYQFGLGIIFVTIYIIAGLERREILEEVVRVE